MGRKYRTITDLAEELLAEPQEELIRVKEKRSSYEKLIEECGMYKLDDRGAPLLDHKNNRIALHNFEMFEFYDQKYHELLKTEAQILKDVKVKNRRTKKTGSTGQIKLSDNGSL